MIVTPDECVDLARQHEELSFHPLMGGLDPELAWASLELFAARVLPRLRASGRPAPGSADGVG